jgi:hypothetical protein
VTEIFIWLRRLVDKISKILLKCFVFSIYRCKMFCFSVAVDSVTPTMFVISENGDLLRWFDCAGNPLYSFYLKLKLVVYIYCSICKHLKARPNVVFYIPIKSFFYIPVPIPPQRVDLETV